MKVCPQEACSHREIERDKERTKRKRAARECVLKVESQPKSVSWSQDIRTAIISPLICCFYYGPSAIAIV